MFLGQFLIYGHVVTREEIEQSGDEGIQEEPPTLDKFKKQVDSYEAVYLEVEKFAVSMDSRSYNSVVSGFGLWDHAL